MSNLEAYTTYNTKQKKEFWRENPLHGEIDVLVPDLPSFKMYCENDDTVVKELYWTNFIGWERTSLQLWNDLLHSNGPSTIYDIGAYSGIYSLIASGISDQNRVYAFDVQKKCIARIEKNVAINALSNVDVVHAACSDNNGMATFYFYEEKDIISSVASLVPKKINNLESQVTSLRLDDFVKEGEEKPAVKLIKIDVEGAELGTLRGMQQLLERDAPDVLIEVNDAKGLKEVKRMFPKGYRVYDINEDRMELKRLNFFNKPTAHRNYLFTTKKNAVIKSIFKGRIV